MSYVDTLIDDVSLFHDGPAYPLKYISGWGSGRNYPESYSCPDGWQAATPWGVICADYPVGFSAPWRVQGPYTGNQAPNTRVQVRDVQLWWLMPSGVWQLGKHAVVPGGSMYHSDWSDATLPPDVRTEPVDNGGGISIRHINRAEFAEYLYHFWASRPLVPASYLGVASCYFARKILHDPLGTDDRSSARLLADTAGDWWITQSAPPAGVGVNTSAMGYNRFKYLTNDWQLISWYSNNTLSAAQIRANPPPFIGLDLLNEQPGPPPTTPFTPLVLPSRGNWFPKLTSAKNTWATHGVANTATNKMRRRRGAKIWS